MVIIYSCKQLLNTQSGFGAIAPQSGRGTRTGYLSLPLFFPLTSLPRGGEGKKLPM
jgi:hypothetical protein